MAIDRIQFLIGGLLNPGMTSSSQSASYRRVVTRVELALAGAEPAYGTVSVKLRLDGVEQTATYTLAAGLRYADNGASLVVDSGVVVDAVIIEGGGAADLDVRLEFSSTVGALGLNTTDLGLGTLGQLKRFLMNAAEVESPTYDSAITMIGRGMSKLFSNRTNRVLRRSVDAMESCPAVRSGYRAKCAPIEEVSLFEVKYGEAYGWSTVPVTSAIELIQPEDGLLRFYPAVMREGGLFRITLTGGYWVDLSDDDSGSCPQGATPLPEDLRLAWLMQCQHIWLNRDNLGIAYSPAGESKAKPIAMEHVTLLPLVGMTLANYSYAAVVR